MTNNREKYKRAFSVLHASQETDWEAIMKTSKEYNMRKTGTKLLLAAVLVSLLAITASAAGVRLMQGWGGNMEVLSVEGGMEVHVHTDNLTEPVEIASMFRLALLSPGFMTEPVPNCFSICASALASAFSLSSASVMLLTEGTFLLEATESSNSALQQLKSLAQKRTFVLIYTICDFHTIVKGILHLYFTKYP